MRIRIEIYLPPFWADDGLGAWRVLIQMIIIVEYKYNLMGVMHNLQRASERA